MGHVSECLLGIDYEREQSLIAMTAVAVVSVLVPSKTDSRKASSSDVLGILSNLCVALLLSTLLLLSRVGKRNAVASESRTRAPQRAGETSSLQSEQARFIIHHLSVLHCGASGAK